MRLGERVKGAAIAIAILLACFPAAAVLTILTSPMWSGFEDLTSLEAYGHSGPAEWCYLVMYGLLVGIATVVWQKVGRARKAKQTPAGY